MVSSYVAGLLLSVRLAPFAQELRSLDFTNHTACLLYITYNELGPLHVRSHSHTLRYIALTFFLRFFSPPRRDI